MTTAGKMIREVLRSAGKKPATVRYPYVKVTMPPEFRGKLVFDPAKCIGCKLCMRDCPAQAIEIVKVGEKRFEARIDQAKCIACGQCVDSCPKDTLKLTGDFELAQLARGKLRVTIQPEPFSEPKPPEPEKKDAK